MKRGVIRGYFEGKEFVMYALELETPEQQKEFERINNAYGAIFDKIHGKTEKELRLAEKKLRERGLL